MVYQAVKVEGETVPASLSDHDVNLADMRAAVEQGIGSAIDSNNVERGILTAVTAPTMAGVAPAARPTCVNGVPSMRPEA